MIQKAFDRWHRFVAGARVILAALFLPIMIFGFIAFPEARIVTSLAIVILSFVIAMYFRSRKRVKPALVAGGDTEQSAHSDFNSLVSGATKLWSINVIVVLTQLVGAVIVWWLSPSRGLISALSGGAIASIVGLGVGILMDRARKNMWQYAPTSIRKLYVLCALSVSLAGFFLALAIWSTPLFPI